MSEGLEICAECDQFAILGLTDVTYEFGYKPVCLDHFEEHLDASRFKSTVLT